MISKLAFKSNVIGACISALIYFVIDVSTGAQAGTALWHAAGLGVVLFILYMAVSLIVVSLKRRRAHEHVATKI
jgi:membrane protein DedA with SNARE-associated domain